MDDLEVPCFRKPSHGYGKSLVNHGKSTFNVFFHRYGELPEGRWENPCKSMKQTGISMGKSSKVVEHFASPRSIACRRLTPNVNLSCFWLGILSVSTYGGFHKWGTPKWIVYNWKSYLNGMIWGYPYLRKPP